VSDEEKSITRQVEHARAFAVSKGWAVAEEFVFVDDGISGAEFSGRPGFVRLMASLTPRPVFGVLIVSEASRLGREQIETAWALKQLAQAGVYVWGYLDARQITVESPQDKLLMSVMAFADELERERARQRTHDALLRKARAGKVAGGAVYGYCNVEVLSDPDANGQRRRLHTERVIDPAEAEVVRRIFRLTAEGYRLRRLAILLNDERVLAPRPRQGGSRSWAPSSIREMLRRELYRGLIVYDRLQKRDAWGRKRYLPRPESEWVKVEAPHLRIVTDEEWTRAHERFVASRASYVKATGGLLFGRPINAVTSPYLLTGLAACAVCGGSMVVLTQDFKRERRACLGCGYNWHRGTTVCDNSLRVATADADREVLSAVTRLLGRRDLIEETVAMALEDLAPRREARDAEHDALTNRLYQLDAELHRLAAAVAEGGGLPALLAALKERQRHRDECQRRLITLQREPRTVDPGELERRIRERLRDCRRLLGRQVAPARQILRELLTDRIAFTPNTGPDRRWYEFAGRVNLLGGLLAGEVGAPQAMVTPAGFEPAISTLKGSRPGPG
jgi:site-specific DNA recombinase